MYNEIDQTSTDIDKDDLLSLLSEERANYIGSQVVTGYEEDQASRADWLDETDNWSKLATQVREKKSFPWPNASNIKFPLLTIACMQFNARAYPALVPSKDVVKAIFYNDSQAGPEDLKLADAIGKHMSYQLLHEMENWQDDMDKLLLIVPIVGCGFKKTYFDGSTKKNCSELVLAKDLVVNYWTKDLEKSSRVTHVLYLSKNEVKERQNTKFYKDIDLGDPTLPDNFNGDNQTYGSTQDETTPYTILEQHTFLDLDDDGYAEPYIVTVDLFSEKVLRIVPRFQDEDVVWGKNDDIISIKPTCYFTKFGFIPNPDGGFYDLGFGHLLGPTNEAVNSLINQLVDAGTLSNMQSGFISKNIRIVGGNYDFKPGEWKVANATGDELKTGIVPLPARDPSNVLFELMGRLTDFGMKVASIADIFVGKMPGQNTPARTTEATVTQGMKLFTAIYKRLYRASDKEYKKLYKLNQLYSPIIPDNPYGIGLNEYKQAGLTVCPTADADAASAEEKIKKAESLLPLVQAQLVNPQEAVSRLLIAQEHDNIEALMTMPESGPNPEMLKLELENKKLGLEAETENKKLITKVLIEAKKFENKAMLEQIKGKQKDKEMVANHTLKFADHMAKVKAAEKKTAE